MCGEEDTIRRDIEIAPLQLSAESRDFKRLDRTGHFHRRKEIVGIYTESPSKLISHSQLFVEAEKDASSRAKSLYNEAATSKHLLVHSNRVFISGQAGIGKTTLSKVLVQEMLDPEVQHFQAEYVFYIRFRDVNYEDKSDLLELLTLNDLFISEISEKDKKKILKNLNECQSVYLVMDGLDEADIVPKSKYPKLNMYSKAKAAAFINRLLFGDLLPNAKIIVLSRPRQLAHLSNDLLPATYFVVNLLGLSEDGQQQICHNLCCKEPLQEEKILDYLNSRPDLKSYCYVPINAIVTMRIFKETTQDRWKTLDSLTTILVTALNIWFLQKLDHFQAKEIAEMAYEGFSQDRYYFKQGHLNLAGVDIKNLMTFMTNVKFFLLDGKELIFYFAHLMWQELFVAIKLSLYTNAEKFANIVSKFNEDKYEVVLKFLFGLSNECTLTELFGHVDPKTLNSLDDRKKSRVILQKIAIDKLKDLVSKPDSFASIIQVFAWIYEMRDDDFTEHAAGCLTNVFSIDKAQVLPTDVPCFNYVLRHRKTPIFLEVIDPLFIGNSFQYFIKELSITLTTYPNNQIRKLILNYYDMNDSRAHHLVDELFVLRVEEIGFNLHDISEPVLCFIIDQISKRKNPLKQLHFKDMSKDKADLAKYLSRCIHKIESLVLLESTLTDEGLDLLVESIRKRNTPMNLLSLDWITISENGVLCLSQCLKNMEQLRFYKCNLTKQGVCALVDQIKERSYPMQKLEVVDFKFKRDDVEACVVPFIGCLHNVKELKLMLPRLLEETKNKLKSRGREVGCNVTFK